MLKRKIQSYIENYLKNQSNRILLIDGARQIGKSFIIKEVGTQCFKHFVEINLYDDINGSKVFDNIRSVDDFYFKLSTVAGDNLGNYADTLVFLDEIQVYPQLLTLLKFLNAEHRFRYIASGSQLGIALKMTTSVPIGSVEIKRMFQLDFEEFLWSCGFNEESTAMLKKKMTGREQLDESMHNRLMDLFRKYLLVGGLPSVVNEYVATKNIVAIRKIQDDIKMLYGIDASQYDTQHKLKINTIYNLIPSNMENKKKRVVYRDIEQKKDKRSRDYIEEFDYLLESGIALGVKAIASPTFPLVASVSKNLIKLYMNDVGLLTNVLFKNSFEAVLNDIPSINLGSVYESVVAQELCAHGYHLFYYDNKEKGEVDYIIDDYGTLSVLPIEVKSGKDYQRHSALNNLLSASYNIKRACVLYNGSKADVKNGVDYLPIYYIMSFDNDSMQEKILL